MYILLHKPRGYITTMSDEKGRKCVEELVRDVGVRVYPIGRLDKDSEGMLLLTNDGDFANAIMHPASHVPKRYRVTLRAAISDEQILKFEEGIPLDGRKTAPAELTVVSRSVPWWKSYCTRGATGRFAGCARPWGCRSRGFAGYPSAG